MKNFTMGAFVPHKVNLIANLLTFRLTTLKLSSDYVKYVIIVKAHNIDTS